MGKLIYGVTKIVSLRSEQQSIDSRQLLAMTFVEAHEELRRVCPLGDLRIHLSVEVDSPEEAGVARATGGRP